MAQSTLGRYWKLFAGILAIVTGLGALSLLPVNSLGVGRMMSMGWARRGWLGALAFGLVGGGAVSVCSLACNPGIYIILGAAMLQGFTLWMVKILVAYALGFALPLGALMLGVSCAAATAKFKGLESAVRRVSGGCRAWCCLAWGSISCGRSEGRRTSVTGSPSGCRSWTDI